MSPPSFKRDILNHLLLWHFTVLSQFQHPILHHYNKLYPMSSDKKIIMSEGTPIILIEPQRCHLTFPLLPLGILWYYSNYSSHEHLKVSKWLWALSITLAPMVTPWYFLRYNICRIFQQQIFVEFLLCTRHCSQHLGGKSSEQKKKNLWFGRAFILVGEISQLK